MRRVVKLHNVIDTRSGVQHSTIIVLEDLAKYFIPAPEKKEVKEPIDEKIEFEEVEPEVDDEIDEVEDEIEEAIEDWLEKEEGFYE